MKRTNLLTKLLPLALCAALMATAAGAVATPTAPQEDAASQARTTVQVWGAITKLEDGSLQVKNDRTEGLNEIILHISEDTLVLGAVDGTPLSLDDLKDGDIIYAYTSPVMTRSLPPQSTAMLILGNIPADFAVPSYYQVTDAISITTLMMENNIINTTVETDQGVTLTFALTDKLDEAGNRQYFQTDGVTFVPYLTKNVVTANDLTPGTRILVWSDIQDKPTKVMIFPYAYAGYLNVFEAGEISVNDRLIEKAAAFSSDEGISYLPVRAVAEAAGCTVTWNHADRSFTISKDGAALVTYVAGTDTALADGDEAILVTPSTTRDGSLYLTATDLTHLLNLYQTR